MSTGAARRHKDHPGRVLLSTSTAVFAASMLGVVGVLGVLEGISAVAKDSVYVTGTSYVLELDVTAWGWIHIVLGVAAVLVALGLFMEQDWARIGGIAIAVLGALANFAFVPYYPVWSLLVIGFYVLVIWALAFQIRRP